MFEVLAFPRHVIEARNCSIGDQVRLWLDSSASDNPAIQRALPAMANIWQYPVKRLGDGQERAVKEQQLTKAAPQTSAQRPISDLQQDTQRIRNVRATEWTRVVTRRSEQEKH